MTTKLAIVSIDCTDAEGSSVLRASLHGWDVVASGDRCPSDAAAW